MPTRIKLNPAAFQSGGVLYGENIKRARVQVGSSDEDDQRNGMAIGIKYTNSSLNTLAGRSSLVVTENPADIDDVQVDAWTKFTKNQLADLVAKGVVIVERPIDPPTALTPAQIRAL